MKKSSSKDISINIGEDKTIIELSKIIQPFQSEIFLRKVFRGNPIEVNLKSFLGLITLNLQNGDTITVKAVGVDSEDAVNAVVEYLTNSS
ncbi:phosphocarrier HPr family protein [Alkalihalophilus pseudofirmus]|uniref:HPr family phosphocarrier protein n=1 Tax=Alkalihalobacterium alkalinitrilicum TaxID=427920 RepID=UPI00094D012C|nr:HPr family phosphocarrier protein [Alkalihalobacterium alkalinitrilicum]OLO42470.1 phosphocarrier HPr family protein [Alkalihalophilus pseudofirmus]